MQRKLFVANRPADGDIPAEQQEASDFKLLCLARVDARQHKDESKREQRGHLDWRRNQQEYSIRMIALCAIVDVARAKEPRAVVDVAEVGKLMSR
uniref:Uncharacterized protein n=1 Tax=Oryza sativa subsp. japonica TaxID=39947 RepID=Q5VPV0_ORYSJ|nr:hypothetical protein [Oryza sativa Japonica Group]